MLAADYLAALSDEYADHYSDLDDRERYDRAAVQHHISELVANKTDFDADKVPINQTWQLMRDTCPRLTDLIDGGKDYTRSSNSRCTTSSSTCGPYARRSRTFTSEQ